MAIRVNYGERARIGVLLPSGNFAAEPELNALMPTGVSMHFTRLPLKGSTREDLIGMTSGVEPAAILMKDASPNLLAFHCTAVSTWDAEMDARLCVRMMASTGIKSITTGRALVEALRFVDAKNVVLLTPYIDEINEREVAFLDLHDVSVASVQGLGLRTPDQMASVSPGYWFDMALTHQRETVDAYVISCTAIRTLPVIEEIEAATKRPVITSNQAMAWYALRQCGIDDQVEGAGALFSHRLGRA